MPEEKLIISMRDLGRLAAFLTTQGCHPLHAIMNWVTLHEVIANEARLHEDQVVQGYIDEKFQQKS